MKKGSLEKFGKVPPRRRRKRRPRNSLMHEVATGMREREGGELKAWNGLREKGGEEK